MGKITLRSFVDKVEEKEKIKLRAWADPETMVDDYEYKNHAADTASVTEFLETRIIPKLSTEDGKTVPIEVLDGNYTKPHGRTTMKTLRSSFDK